MSNGANARIHLCNLIVRCHHGCNNLGLDSCRSDKLVSTLGCPASGLPTSRSSHMRAVKISVKCEVLTRNVPTTRRASLSFVGLWSIACAKTSSVAERIRNFVYIVPDRTPTLLARSVPSFCIYAYSRTNSASLAALSDHSHAQPSPNYVQLLPRVKLRRITVTRDQGCTTFTTIIDQLSFASTLWSSARPCQGVPSEKSSDKQ